MLLLLKKSVTNELFLLSRRSFPFSYPHLEMNAAFAV